VLDPQTFLSDKVRRGDYYFLDLMPDPATDLAVVCGGREVCDHTYLVDRPGFRYTSLEFVASGQGTLYLGDRCLDLVPGSTFSYGPGVPHRIEVAQGSSMVKYFVDFVGFRAEELVSRAFPEVRRWQVTSTAWVQRLFEDLKVAADSLQQSRTEVCALIVRQLLCLLVDRAHSGSPQDAQLSLKFRKLRANLQDIALKGYNLEEAARSCGVSPSYLSRLFRKFDSVTPQRFMLQCRMAFAASLLLDPQLLVKEVALLSGYEDQHHFSRNFKVVYGCSPEAFRKLRT